MKANRIDINEVVNMNGNERKFSFRAAKLHYPVFYNKIMQVEGNKMQRDGKTFGAAQARHYSLTREELQNKAFLTCRTALQKGKLPKGIKEKDIKAICFSAAFIATLEKCQIATGFNSDKLLRAIDKELKTSAKKNSKKSNKK